MKVRVMTLDEQTEHIYECDYFRFRANQVSNWLKLYKDEKEIAHISRVCVLEVDLSVHKRGDAF